MNARCFLGSACMLLLLTAASGADKLPLAPAGFEVTTFAKEPLVRNPCSMAFDAKGRLFVGMGPQFRMPKPDTPGDSVVIVLDHDGDGRADATKVFATGFNCVQSLAWRGRDLWVANSPDLTIVRDLDGDDEADEYVRVYTDLGNLEHGLHGLNWGPDGKLYMSKGNSKGLTKPGRIAPKPFRDLWGVKAPEGSPDLPPPITYKKGDYRHAYHDPADDWGREGGVLRCDERGEQLEIISRGFRNPWDITFDAGFNWLGTDNDQTTGDRVFMPFPGAHFGWNHPWSSHWNDDPHPPTAPVSGPLFEGSGTGLVWVDHPQLPPELRGSFLINDWLRKTTFVWRPEWDGALMRPKGGNWEPILQKGESLFNPTDIEIGPDGAIWCLSWGGGYGANLNKDGSFDNEGRVYRIAWKDAPPMPDRSAKQKKPLADWTAQELIDDFAGPLPVWRTDAQVELVRRGGKVYYDLIGALRSRKLSPMQETWVLWTLGLIVAKVPENEPIFEQELKQGQVVPLNAAIQIVRILAFQSKESGGKRPLPQVVVDQLQSTEPRLRMAAVEAIGQARPKLGATSILSLLAVEKDATVFYSAWQTLRTLLPPNELEPMLADPRAGVRRAVLLALLESQAIKGETVRKLSNDADGEVREIVDLYLGKSSGKSPPKKPSLTLGTGGASGTLPNGPPLVRKIASRGQREYRPSPEGLRPGAKVYSDRDYVVKEVPPALVGADFLQTANDDDGSKGDNWLTFEALVPLRVYVGIDKRSTATPRWVRERFTAANLPLVADHWTFELYSRKFPAGLIELGGNTDDGRGGGKGNYTVILEPLPLAAPKAPPEMAAALALVEKGDAARGAVLFSHRGGIGCVKCHRVGSGPNNSLAPDLSSIGLRATAKHLVESILAPSQVITEGFRLHQVETTTGLIHSGILLEESGLSVTLGLATGERLTVLKDQIESRQFAAISAMPSFGPVLSEQQVADLAAFLLQQKAPLAPAPPKVAVPMTTVVMPSDTASETKPPAEYREEGKPWSAVQHLSKLDISCDRKPIAEYVFRDPRIKRPFLANLQLPSGTRVTRNHPPQAGDSGDHDTMHPGLWFGFGDISGVDFWRNQGRIEHLKFVGPPTLEKDSIQFIAESRLLAPGDKAMGRMTNRVTLRKEPAGVLIVWQATFHADDQELIFGDQEEMGFGARVATPLTEKATGLITSSAGLKTAANTWGKGAAWCDYRGKINDMPTGITLFSGPANFREAWWHNRDYGVFVANPFGRAAMRQGAKSSVVVKKGESLRLDFGAMIHAGEYDPRKGYEEFVERLASQNKEGSKP